jgi:hypothetical protein
MIAPHSLMTKGNKKFLKLGQKYFFFKFIYCMTPLYIFAKNPLIATGMALCVGLGQKCKNTF